MARLWTSGFELADPLNQAGASIGVEFNYTSTGVVGISMVTTPVRSGTYSCKLNGASGTSYLFHPFKSANGNGPFWTRLYLHITAYPNVANTIIEMDAVSGATGAQIRLNTNGSLSLLNAANSQIGSSSSVLSLNTWYRVELKMDMTGGSGANILEAALDGSVFATTSTSTQTQQVGAIFFGAALEGEALTSGTWYFDDLAINDNTGSFQTSYPGAGNVIHLKPNAAGDVNSFATQTGGSAGSSNNFTRVNEVPPNEATSLNGSNILNQEDLFNVDDSGIGASDTVSVVQAGGRFRNNIADATTAFKFEVEKTSGGTISQSSAIISNTTIWCTNIKEVSSQANQLPYPITLYQDPDSSNWTKTTLDSMQIGYKITAGSTNRIELTNTWALVEYVPASGNNINTSDTVTTSESVGYYSETIFTREQTNLTLISNINKSDTITTSESASVSVSGASDLTINVSDTITTSENVIVLIPTLLVTASDAITTSEATQLQVTSFISASDTITTSENTKLEETSFISKSDTITTSESVVLLETSFINASDQINTSENVILLIPTLFISVSDTVTLSEAVVMQDQDGIAVSDNITISENVQTLITPLLVNTSDTITTSESSKEEVNSFISKSDTITFSENAVGGLNPIFLSVSDTITFSENVSLSLVIGIVINVSDTLTTSENVQLLIPTLFITASDTLTFTESPLLDVPVNKSVSDTLTTSESILRLLTSFINASDTITTSENAVIDARNLQLSVSDNLTFTEFVRLTLPGPAVNLSTTQSLSFSEHVVVRVLHVVEEATGDSLETITPINGATIISITGTDSTENITLIIGQTLTSVSDAIDISTSGTPLISVSRTDSTEIITTVSGSTLIGANDSLEPIDNSNATQSVGDGDSLEVID